MDEQPIARCDANDVEAYEYPFFVKPEQGMQPAYIFLEDHVYNFDTDEASEILDSLVRIENEQDLKALGFQKNDDGIYMVSATEKPWLDGGQS